MDAPDTQESTTPSSTRNTTSPETYAPSSAESAGLHSQLARYFQSCCVRHATSATPFDTVCARSVCAMLQAVREYALLADPLVCATVLYIQRFLRHRRTVLTNHNVRPLFAVALNTVSKYYDDLTYNNLTFAHVAGIPIHTFNLLEIDFLASLRFNLALNPDRVHAILLAFQHEPVLPHPPSLLPPPASSPTAPSALSGPNRPAQSRPPGDAADPHPLSDSHQGQSAQRRAHSDHQNRHG